MAVCGPMADGPVLFKKRRVEDSPESKSLDLLFGKKGRKGPDYLKGVLDFVSNEKRHKIFDLKKPAGARWKIGPLEDTIYSEEPKVVNGWGKFYLPEIVSMQVIGVVEGTSCPWDQLVLMICEDGKLYTYDGEELHLVASSPKKLRQNGISYPGSKRYYEGQAFKDKTKEDWEKVRNRPMWKRQEQEHLKLSKIMEYLKATAAIKDLPYSKTFSAATMEFGSVDLEKAPRKKKNTKLLEEEQVQEHTKSFLSNAEGIIYKMLELNNSCQDEAIQLVDEILHSIFFFGAISTPPLSPENIFSDNKFLNALRHCYPLPFEHYLSQLPRRSPFSCFLDMIVFMEGRENENEIKRKLQEIIRELGLGERDPLVSSTICVSQKNPESERHYGVSMSTSGRYPGRIMVAASCLPGSWDSYVAGAVMTFNQNTSKKPYFDGTIKLPQHVTCQAYSLHGEGAQMDPCKSCVELFGLGGDDTKRFLYGNCAEVESVSNLFKKDTEVREQARPTSELCTPENRSKAEESVRDDLRNLLKIFKFPSDDFHFYIPSA